jgi:RimJ/RimL family protein N-acetyltransferase
MIKFANEQFNVTKFSSSHAEPNKVLGRVMEKCGLNFTGYGEFKKLDGTGIMR